MKFSWWESRFRRLEHPCFDMRTATCIFHCFYLEFLPVGLEEDREFPVEILPYLFLGNAANSEDIQSLMKHSIQVR